MTDGVIDSFSVMGGRAASTGIMDSFEGRLTLCSDRLEVVPRKRHWIDRIFRVIEPLQPTLYEPFTIRFEEIHAVAIDGRWQIESRLVIEVSGAKWTLVAGRGPLGIRLRQRDAALQIAEVIRRRRPDVPVTIDGEPV